MIIINKQNKIYRKINNKKSKKKKYKFQNLFLMYKKVFMMLSCIMMTNKNKKYRKKKIFMCFLKLQYSKLMKFKIILIRKINSNNNNKVNYKNKNKNQINHNKNNLNKFL